MNYYIFKNGDQITGYCQTDRALSPPAISVSKEEFIKLGFYHEESQIVQIPLETQLEALSERQEFIEDCIAEMAMVIYSE